MNTLLLTATNWDLTTDVSNNIALATGRYAIAQDVASECRVFRGEAWYSITRGVPYLGVTLSLPGQILGILPSLNFVKTMLIAAGLQVPGTTSIKAFLTGPGRANRTIGGQLQITDNTGNVLVVQTTNLAGILPWYINEAVDGAYEA